MKWSLNQHGVLVYIKSHLLSLSDMDITSQFSPSKNEEMMEKEAAEIDDDKIHTEDVLQRFKN